ncbi:MAG: hypothetical protein HY014_16400 [Acidobacteria bacterium]|nr:hypothetical protein [Acidobacteriota bacterium]MBI3489712.1 hypothetical protein [Acidobacteriota bacterium]
MRFFNTAAFGTGLMMCLTVSSASLLHGGSKYAKISNGVGNVLVGEVLPYNDDAGYKNVVTDSVKLSEMKEWETFYYRAFFDKKIKDITHDLRVLVWHIEGVGERAGRFNREVGGNFILVASREGDTPAYGERTEWSRYFEQFSTKKEALMLTEYHKKYDHTQPETFTYRTLSEDIGDEVPFSPQVLEEWKEKYGIPAVVITLDAFSFVNGGKTSEGENKKVISRNSDGTYEEKEKLAKVKTFTVWENKKHLARGKFKIVLD